MLEIPIGWFTIISQEDVEEMRGTYGEERTATATVRSLQIESNPSRSGYAYLALIKEEDKEKLLDIAFENDEGDVVVSVPRLAGGSITPCVVSRKAVGAFPAEMKLGADVRVAIEISVDGNGQEYLFVREIMDVIE